jgi:hypothetical protein
MKNKKNESGVGDHKDNLAAGMTPIESQMSMFYGKDVREFKIKPVAPGVDFGADPLGPDENGEWKWRMVPSGDIVNQEERGRRLKGMGI